MHIAAASRPILMYGEWAKGRLSWSFQGKSKRSTSLHRNVDVVIKAIFEGCSIQTLRESDWVRCDVSLGIHRMALSSSLCIRVTCKVLQGSVSWETFELAAGKTHEQVLTRSMGLSPNVVLIITVMFVMLLSRTRRWNSGVIIILSRVFIDLIDWLEKFISCLSLAKANGKLPFFNRLFANLFCD